MSEVRAFINDVRIATGRNGREGRFFQAYPDRLYFDNVIAWRQHIINNNNDTIKFVETFPKKLGINPIETIVEHKPVEYKPVMTFSMKLRNSFKRFGQFFKKPMICPS